MKYIHSFELDETLYPIGGCQENFNDIKIRMLKRNQFTPFVIGSFMNKSLNKGYINNFDCFYTEVNSWVGDVNYHLSRDEKKMFVLTKEHLVSIRTAKILGLLDRANRPLNILGAASYFNYKIGHIPLVLKLWIKRNLKKINYSRTELTKTNSYIILNHIIDLQNKFVYSENYPWQPQNYENKNELKISQSIFDEMLKVDKQFLLISNLKEGFQFLKEYNPDWIEKFINN